MNNVTGVEIVACSEQLEHDEPLVDVLQDSALADDVVQVGGHELEDEEQITVVLGTVHIQQLRN